MKEKMSFPISVEKSSTCQFIPYTEKYMKRTDRCDFSTIAAIQRNSVAISISKHIHNHNQILKMYAVAIEMSFITMTTTIFPQMRDAYLMGPWPVQLFRH